LNVFPIPLPPLRDRKDDLPSLTAALLSDLNRKHGTKVTDVAKEVMDRFRSYNWPGNVRELRNAMERAVILAGEGTIQASHLSVSFGGSSAPAAAAQTAAAPTSASNGDELRIQVGSTIEQAERALIELTLEHTRHNKTRAAEVLGISQKTLFNKLKEYGAQTAGA
jgi:DNA-binding NtrC family response regulator